MYAGYDDGFYDNVLAIRTRFPGKLVLAITTNPADNFGDVLDVEKGDANPVDAPAWVRRRRIAGHDGPIVYCSESAWPSVKGAFAAARTDQPSYWVAGYPGYEGDAIPPGAIGHQWIDHNGVWDESIMVDYLPGIDPDPNPTEPTQEQIMQAILVNNEVRVYAANPAGHLMEFTKTPTGWSVDDVTAEITKANPGTQPFLVAP
jgi:hypothetical protein